MDWIKEPLFKPVTPRLAEDGRRRFTESGETRILEGDAAVWFGDPVAGATWTNETTAPATWEAS